MLKMEVDTRELEEMVGGTIDALSDMREAWPDVKTVLQEFVAHHFETEGEYPSGERWVPLSPAYAEWKKRNHPDKPIMHLTERLYGSLTEDSHSDQVYYASPNSMEFGTRDPKAVAHQFGRPEINLPAREVLPEPSKEEGERIVDVIMAYLFRKVRELRGR